jgi:mono/diheme cytochrome c family protein
LKWKESLQKGVNIMKKIPAAILGIFLVISLLWAEISVGAEEIEGKSLYVQKCLICHGKNGDGKGSAASFLSAKPANFTGPTFWKDYDNKMISDAIENGRGEMPAFNLTQDEINAIIKYLSQTFKK